VQFTAPAGLKVPAAHVAHALPGVGEPMPAAQSVQLAEPSVDVAPAAQGFAALHGQRRLSHHS
jgi:hypothetical protein